MPGVGDTGVKRLYFNNWHLKKGETDHPKTWLTQHTFGLRPPLLWVGDLGAASAAGAGVGPSCDCL